MNQLEHDDIVRLTEDIWGSTLGVFTCPTDDHPGALAHRKTVDGMIHIAGRWRGTVMVQMAHDLARRVATIMFRLDGQPPSDADVHDAIGEITNMTGGSIKGLIDGECFLSLPAVVEGQGYEFSVPGTRVVNRVSFACEGEPFVVSVVAPEQIG
jgi:CheY-specific phosphatase CheX